MDLESKLLANFVLLFLLVITVIATVRSQHLVKSTVLLSVMSLLVAMMYLVLGAPDVAITEAAVGAGVSTLLMLSALVYTGSSVELRDVKHRLGAFIVVLITGSVLLYATVDMPSFGSPESPAHLYLSVYYIEEAWGDIGIPNLVTAILASYRGYDTLGETCVVFTAGLSVYALLCGTRNEQDISMET